MAGQAAAVEILTAAVEMAADYKTLTIDQHVISCEYEDLQVLVKIGRGTFGDVKKMRHKKSQIVMAVRPVRIEEENMSEIHDKDLLIRNATHPNIVKLYGVLLWSTEALICMEFMYCSVDVLSKQMRNNGKSMPEPILRQIARSVINGLDYLIKEHKVKCNSLKPSKIFVNRSGEVKLADIVFSQYQVQDCLSRADDGLYVSPDKITRFFDSRTVIWCVGIVILELAIQKYPYEEKPTPFERLRDMMLQPPPKAPEGKFSPEFESFIDSCLQKERDKRANCTQLLKSAFITKLEEAEVDISAFICQVLDEVA